MKTQIHYYNYLNNTAQQPRSARLTKLCTALLASPADRYYLDVDKGNHIINFAKLTTGIELDEFQKFILHSLYSWRRSDTHLRRFNHAYISLARKHGKSFLAALIALYELLYGESKPNNKQIYVAANSLRQAQVLYNMVAQHSRSLMGQSRTAAKLLSLYSKKVEVRSTNSFIEVLSGNASKLDGLDVSCFILDEFSMSPTTELRDVLTSSQLLQPSPLNIIISTHSMELSFPWLTQEIPYLDQILDGKLPLTNYLPVFYELDALEELSQPELWSKANPFLLTQPHLKEYLTNELERAKQTGDTSPVLTKNFNLISSKGAGAMFQVSSYTDNLSSTPLGSFRGKDVYVGVDLSYTNDLSSVVYSIIKEGRVYVYSENFVVESADYNLLDRSRESGINFRRLQEQGKVHVCADRINSTDVALSIIETVERYGLNLKGIYFDNALSSSFIERINSEGYGTYLRVVRQGPYTLSPATQSFMEFLTQDKIRFIENELMREALLNVREKRVNDSLYYDKSANRNKIDPFSALINTFMEVPHADLDESTADKLTRWQF